MSELEKTLEERGSVYGDFRDQATIAQQLKDTMRKFEGWDDMGPHHKEALDMIQHKVARLINGDPNHQDSWHDIGGYAKCVEDRLPKQDT